MRSPPTIEGAIRNVIARERLDRIEIHTRDGKTFYAAAYPDKHHPVINQRMEAAFAATGKTDFTLAEVDAIRKKAQDAITRATGATIDEALGNLSAALTAPPKEGH